MSPHPAAEAEAEADRARLRLTESILENTHLSIWQMLSRTSSRFPDRIALLTGTTELTYQELESKALACAEHLHRKGVTKGTRVAFLMHAVPEWAVLHYALARLGAVAIPVSLAFEQDEIAHIIRSAAPSYFFTIDTFRGKDHSATVRAAIAQAHDTATPGSGQPHPLTMIVLPLAANGELDSAQTGSHLDYFTPTGDHVSDSLDLVPVPRPSDPAYIVFTSGSTSAPKPALCSHSAFLGAATGFGEALLLDENDRFLAMLPPFHTGGIACSLTMPHVVGASTYLLHMFTAEAAFEAIRTSNCTATIGFDAMYTKIIELNDYSPTAVSSLRKAAVAATASFIERLRRSWPLDVVATTYGSTESGSLAAITPSWETDIPETIHANGMVLPGVDLIIADPATSRRCGVGERGEIRFRGWGRMIEYLGMPAATRASIDEHGYFHSGDIGFIDDRGFLHFEGRYKQMIKTGGENVSEREVEQFLESSIDGVEFAQVVGVPDEVWGEIVVAFVHFDGPGEVESLRERALGRIARYKIPRHFFTIPSGGIPALANGRPDKTRLREIAGRLLKEG